MGDDTDVNLQNAARSSRSTRTMRSAWNRLPVPSFALEWWKFGAPERMKMGTAISLSERYNFLDDSLGR
ncbi:MAG TPA: hypothetical protein PLD19_12295 [Luteimonas sp.]|nr:hypothetical protein [Luteimonas sp.]